MPLSYFVNQEFVNTPYTINNYSIHKFDEEHVLITTEHGSWIVLNKQEFDLLRTSKLTEDLNLFTALEDKGVILTEGNFDRVAQMYKERFPHLFNGITLQIVTPTLRCNLKCVYCGASSVNSKAKGYDMDEKTAKAVVDFMFQSPSKFFTIEFQGGEPLLNFPIIQYVMEYAKRKNESKSCEGEWWKGKKDISFRLVSNFTLMDTDILDYLIENKVSLCTSLDGPKKLHDKNRIYTKAGSYKTVTYWIDYIKKVLHAECNAIPTASRYSLPFAKEIVDEYLKHGLDSIKMRPLNIAGTAITAWEKIGYTSEQYVNFWKEFIEYIFALNKKGIKVKDIDATYMLRRIITLKPPFNACLGSPCGACLIQAGYDQRGDVYTCDEGRACDIFKLGNVKKDSYKKVFGSPEALNFIGLTSSVSTMCDACEWHPYCSPCLVSTFGAQKNLISKLPSDFLCKIRGSQAEYLFKKLVFSEEEKEILLNWVS
jgi:His-Xaa-Ser system radical SAM maturase HxsB